VGGGPARLGWRALADELWGAEWSEEGEHELGDDGRTGARQWARRSALSTLAVAALCARPFAARRERRQTRRELRANIGAPGGHLYRASKLLPARPL